MVQLCAGSSPVRNHGTTIRQRPGLYHKRR
jgi:hypothetical protein